MSWTREQSWKLSKYTDLRFPSNNPVVLEHDLYLIIQKSAKLLVLSHGNRTLHQVPLREPFPVIRFRDLSFYVSLKIRESDIRFRFRTQNMNDTREISAVISQFTHVQEHTSKSRGSSEVSNVSNHSPSPSQEIYKYSDSYDMFGSGSESQSSPGYINSPLYNPSPVYNPSPTPPYGNQAYYGNNYRNTPMSANTTIKSTSDVGSQTDEQIDISEMSTLELKHFITELSKCAAFRRLLNRMENAVDTIEPASFSQYDDKKDIEPLSKYQQDSILRRF